MRLIATDGVARIAVSLRMSVSLFVGYTGDLGELCNNG